MHKLIILTSLFFIINLNCKQKNQILDETEKTKPTVIFIHGTLFPMVNLAVRAFDCPIGLTKVQDLPYFQFIKGL